MAFTPTNGPYHKIPTDVGILAIEIYFPKLYVQQDDLEAYDKVSSGKYTIGLGQDCMAFNAECEDIYSMCLTVVQNLMDKCQNRIGYKDIGRLEVGTETIMDKSKSIKSVLMQLFTASGNFNVEGVDNINACYGATAALFNTVNWVYSPAWDGRYGIVVGGDIAVYAEGPARPTGGSGAIAMLIGPSAPLVLDPIKSTFAAHLYDFYKPRLESEYPVVDGRLSIQCYLQALDSCYTDWQNKVITSMQSLKDKNASQNNTNQSNLNSSTTDLSYVCFHSPYSKLVEKSYARLHYLDLLCFKHHQHNLKGYCYNTSLSTPENLEFLKVHGDKIPEQTYFDKDLEKDLMGLAKAGFREKTLPTLRLAKQIGNMYTPSLYGSLISLLGFLFSNQTNGETHLNAHNGDSNLICNGSSDQFSNEENSNNISGDGNMHCENGVCYLKPVNNNNGYYNNANLPLKIGMFSYGSGAIATFFTLTLKRVPEYLSNFNERLAQRVTVEPETFAQCLKEREATHLTAPYKPKIATEQLFPGTFYLTEMDDKYRRNYERF